MKQVVLIGCGSQKQPSGTHKAKELYTSGLFKAKWRYAESLGCPIHIISAKHHLLDPEKEIAPYDVTLKCMSAENKKKWARKVYDELKAVYRDDFKDCQFIILAGMDYYKNLIKLIGADQCTLPLAHLRQGEQMKFCNEEAAKKA